MIDLQAYIFSGGVLLAVAVIGWLVSLIRRDVSIVDSLWSLMFLFVAAVYAWLIDVAGPRQFLVLGLTGLWALRLSVYISWRNHGKPEDHRYQEIRRNNEPGFWFKSLFIVFIFQAFLAWIISVPLVLAISSQAEFGWLDYAAVLFWMIGMFFESVGDLQLARFKADASNAGKVLDQGLWSLSRHPNYFGNFMLWWGFYLFALSAGGWWSVFSPLLMSLLLLKVSGVALLEKDIAHRRPAYREYIERTNAFFPGPKRT